MHWFLKFIFGIKLYMFRTVPLSIIRSFSLYTQQWYMSYRSVDSLRAGSGRNCRSVLILLASCQQTCVTYTVAVCKVWNSWWWTEEMSETCRVKEKGKAAPLQAWSGPEGSRKLTFPDFMTTAQDSGKVVSLNHRPPLPPGNAPGTHFC